MAQRSGQQNKSLYKYFSLLAQELNTKGITPVEFVKDDVPMRWTPAMVNEFMFPIHKLEAFDCVTKTHKNSFLGDVADELNGLGVDMRMYLPDTGQLQWDKDLVKVNVWHTAQRFMYGTDSTTDLSKSQVDPVHEIINSHTREKYGIDIEFPHDKKREETQASTIQKDVEKFREDGVYDGDPEVIGF